MTVPVWILTIIFGVGLSAVIAYLGGLAKRLQQMELDMAVSKTQLVPLWAQVQNKLTEDLHHDDPQFHEADRLIEKLAALTITDDERHRLKQLLTERVSDTNVPDMERKKAKALIAVMDIVLIESEDSKAEKDGKSSGLGGQLGI